MYSFCISDKAPNPLQQLFYYTKSLCVPTPFSSTKESIMTLFGSTDAAKKIWLDRLIALGS
ncbi:hypothetical protein F5Y07DRAFT_384904 [Xylaria sp. FL0933]|nr:hypothetical protein F5Y07DRAFT_384904 [Xylaria sp. FL0933]